MSKKSIIFTPREKITSLVGVAPTPAVSHVPDWYKSIPQHINVEQLRLHGGQVNSTIKGCSPFLDALTAGYMVTLDSDVLVTWSNGYPQFNWKGNRDIISSHSIEQTRGLSAPQGYFPEVVKWQNYFQVSTPPGYSLWCTHPSNRFDLPFLTLNGFVDTDLLTFSIHFPFFIKDGFEGVLEQGTPIAQLIPVKRDSWESSIGEFKEDEVIASNEMYKKRIVRGYKHYFWSKKRYG